MIKENWINSSKTFISLLIGVLHFKSRNDMGIEIRIFFHQVHIRGFFKKENWDKIFKISITMNVYLYEHKAKVFFFF